MDPELPQLGEVTIQRLPAPKPPLPTNPAEPTQDAAASLAPMAPPENKAETLALPPFPGYSGSTDMQTPSVDDAQAKRNLEELAGPSLKKGRYEGMAQNQPQRGSNFAAYDSDYENSEYESEEEFESDIESVAPQKTMRKKKSSYKLDDGEHFPDTSHTEAEESQDHAEPGSSFIHEFVNGSFTPDQQDIKQEVPDAVNNDNEYEFDIKEKLKEMGEITFETVKNDSKPKKVEPAASEITLTPAKKTEDDEKTERKGTNLRRNIREVMDETKLDESTLAAQRQEMERLRRVQEQQRLIREMQRQMAQDRVINMLQGKKGPHPGTSGTRIGNSVLMKLPNGQTKPMTPYSRKQMEVMRPVPRGAVPPYQKGRPMIPVKRPIGPTNLTPSVSIAPVGKRPLYPHGVPQHHAHHMAPSDSDSEEYDEDMVPTTITKPKPEPVATIDISSDDDCIVVSESENDPTEDADDPTNSGMHTNDEFNQPDDQGRVVINIGHPDDETDIYLAPQIARVIKPHQIGGIRFLYDNIIESVNRFETSSGFGCILAHSMGLGKTLQIVTFSDIFLRHTPAKTILCIMPINTLQNWLAEYNMWLPLEENVANSSLLAHGEVRPRNFALHVLNDSQKTLTARSKVIREWTTKGGVLLIGYEQYRLLSLRKHPKSRSKKNTPEQKIEEDEKNKKMFDDIHEALVNPGPDLVICDEGHRIKNSHASTSQALKQMKTKRRVVLTGYPLQNNLMEYWCMVDFVRPNYLGTKTEFCNMFERPIQNGQCIDSTEADIKLMRYRAHVLHSLLLGFVQRRSHRVLQTALPQKQEYVLLIRMTDFQRKLYETFMNEVVRSQTVPNPLKAFAVCCKIWNHPDVLYYFLKKQAKGDAVDIDLEEVSNSTSASELPLKAIKSRTNAKKGKGKKAKPAASVTPYNTNTTADSTLVPPHSMEPVNQTQTQNQSDNIQQNYGANSFNAATPNNGNYNNYSNASNTSQSYNVDASGNQMQQYPNQTTNMNYGNSNQYSNYPAGSNQSNNFAYNTTTSDYNYQQSNDTNNRGTSNQYNANNQYTGQQYTVTDGFNANAANNYNNFNNTNFNTGYNQTTNNQQNSTIQSEASSFTTSINSQQPANAFNNFSNDSLNPRHTNAFTNSAQPQQMGSVSQQISSNFNNQVNQQQSNTFNGASSSQSQQTTVFNSVVTQQLPQQQQVANSFNNSGGPQQSYNNPNTMQQQQQTTNFNNPNTIPQQQASGFSQPLNQQSNFNSGSSGYANYNQTTYDSNMSTNTTQLPSSASNQQANYTNSYGNGSQGNYVAPTSGNTTYESQSGYNRTSNYNNASGFSSTTEPAQQQNYNNTQNSTFQSNQFNQQTTNTNTNYVAPPLQTPASNYPTNNQSFDSANNTQTYNYNAANNQQNFGSANNAAAQQPTTNYQSTNFNSQTTNFAENSQSTANYPQQTSGTQQQNFQQTASYETAQSTSNRDYNQQSNYTQSNTNSQQYSDPLYPQNANFNPQQQTGSQNYQNNYTNQNWNAIDQKPDTSVCYNNYNQQQQNQQSQSQFQGSYDQYNHNPNNTWPKKEEDPNWIKKEENIYQNPVKNELMSADVKPKINILSDIKFSNVYDSVGNLIPEKKINIISDIKLEPKKEELDIKDEVKPEIKVDSTEPIKIEDDDLKLLEPTKPAVKEDTGIPYDWAIELLKDYIPGIIENSAKMEILFCIIRESIALGDRLLVFSQSLITLDLIEQFLQSNIVPGDTVKWAKNTSYFRLDGSTAALEREKLINEFNANPKVYLFLVSTRAGSLGINLIGANRVVVLDASWNPCHDTQAVCRVYRYGQQKQCYVYRFVVDNCLEKKIYDRQINKQGMSDRVVDECNPDAYLTMKDVSTLCFDDEKEVEEKDWSFTKENYSDPVLKKVLESYGRKLNKEPFQHESLLVDRKEKQLSRQEKRLAKKGYEREKQAARQPTYGMVNTMRGHRPIASVRPMQQGTERQTRWIPAEHWQRQGMTAQEMTLPLDVVIPTNQPEKGNIVLKAGQKVLVLKSPKGVYMQLESGKIVAIKTAIKVRGKAEEDAATRDNSNTSNGPSSSITSALGGSMKSKTISPSASIPPAIKNNSAITVVPQKRVVKPFAPGMTKLNVRSVKQTVPNLANQIKNVTKKAQSIKGRVNQIGSEIARAVRNSHESESHPISSSEDERPPTDRRQNYNMYKHSSVLKSASHTSRSESDDGDLIRSEEDSRESIRGEPSSHSFKPFPKEKMGSSALQRLEQSTSALMSNSKQPFRDTLDSITSSYHEDKTDDRSTQIESQPIPIEDDSPNEVEEVYDQSSETVSSAKTKADVPPGEYPYSYYNYSHGQPYPPPPPQAYTGYPPQPPYDPYQQPTPYNYYPQGYPPPPPQGQYPPPPPQHYDYAGAPPPPAYAAYPQYPPQPYPAPPPGAPVYAPPPGAPSAPSPYPEYQYPAAPPPLAPPYYPPQT